MHLQVPKIIAAFTYPRLAIARLRRGLLFDELIVMQGLREAGLLNGIRTIIDAGAHTGSYARVCSYMVPSANVVCFEPVPDTYAILLRDTSKWPKIRAHCVALGSRKGSSSMNISQLEAASSLLPMTAMHKELWPESAATHSITINVRTLDDFVAEHCLEGEIFVKADVQGYELELLRGAKTLLRRVRLLRLELSFAPMYEGAASFAETCAFLEQAGFRFLAMVGAVTPRTKALPIQGDFLFVNNNFRST